MVNQSLVEVPRPCLKIQNFNFKKLKNLRLKEAHKNNTSRLIINAVLRFLRLNEKFLGTICNSILSVSNVRSLS